MPQDKTADYLYKEAQKGIAKRKATRSALKSLQQPSDDNWLKATILGGLGGVGEGIMNLLAPPEDAPIDEQVDAYMMGQGGLTGGMLKMPSKFVGKFAQNFQRFVPEQLAQDGHPEIADVVENFAKNYPSAAGQLQTVVVPDSGTSRGYGDYISDIISGAHPRIERELEIVADAGLPAPSNNAIRLNPLLHTGTKEFNAAEAISPSLTAPHYLHETMKHEGTHLAQDILGRLDMGAKLPYGLRPNEVLARLSQTNTPVTNKAMILEAVNGLNYHRPGDFSDPIDIMMHLGDSFREMLKRRGKTMSEITNQDRAAVERAVRMWYYK